MTSGVDFHNYHHGLTRKRKKQHGTPHQYTIPDQIITLRHSTAQHTTPQHIRSHHITSHHITSHHITSHHTTPHHTTPHHTTPHHTTPHHTTPHHTTPHHTTPHHTTPHHTTPHHTTPHHTRHHIKSQRSKTHPTALTDFPEATIASTNSLDVIDAVRIVSVRPSWNLRVAALSYVGGIWR